MDNFVQIKGEKYFSSHTIHFREPQKRNNVRKLFNNLLVSRFNRFYFNK